MRVGELGAHIDRSLANVHDQLTIEARARAVGQGVPRPAPGSLGAQIDYASARKEAEDRVMEKAQNELTHRRAMWEGRAEVVPIYAVLRETPDPDAVSF